MNKKIECEIVQDLLLGYVDNTLNGESKKLVEEHLKECDECKKRLKDITEDSFEDAENEVDYLKSINKKISKKNKCIIIGSILLVIIIIFNICVFVNYYKQLSKAEIFLDSDISEEQKENIENKLKSYGDNLKITYNSKENELNKMRENLGENSYLLDNYDGENNIFPASFTVEGKPSIIEKIQEELVHEDGVKKITSYINSNPYELYIIKIFEK